MTSNSLITAMSSDSEASLMSGHSDVVGAKAKLVASVEGYFNASASVYESKDKEIAKLTKKILDMGTRIDDWEQGNYAEEIETLKGEKADLIKANKKLSKEKDVLEDQNLDLEAENAILTKNFDELKEEAVDLETDKAVVDTKYAALMKKYNNVKARKRGLINGEREFLHNRFHSFKCSRIEVVRGPSKKRKTMP